MQLLTRSRHKWHADLREWIMTPEEKEKQEAEAKAKLDAEEKAKSGEGKTKDDNP